ncbi:MAG: cbb3-type cytochrome c oxidase subunit I [Gammaproteobacteria bacterium]
MQEQNASSGNSYYLLKYLVASASFFFVGTIHGVLQVISPIRAWLDSIGSPYGGPGHMIDPLAHAHINVVGGVVLLCMATTYYLFQAISGKRLYSKRMANQSFWWTTLGVMGFYSTLLIFGIWEGNLMLQGNLDELDAVHKLYGPIIGTVSTALGIGFWIFFANVYLTARKIYKKQ